MKISNEALVASIESVLVVLNDMDKLLSILSDELGSGLALQGVEQEFFIRGLPVELALVSTVQRDLDRCVTDLDAASSFLAEMSKANGEKETV